MATSREQVAQLADPLVLIPYLQARVSRTKQGDDSRGEVVAYLGARDVAAVADEIIGATSWSFEIVEEGIFDGWMARARGRLTIHLEGGYEIVRMDTGTTKMQIKDGKVKSDSVATAIKGAPSDAFKRCFAQLGLGRELSHLSKPWVDVDYGKPKNPKQTTDKWAQELRQRAGQNDTTGEVAPVAATQSPPATTDEARAKNRWKELVKLCTDVETGVAFLVAQGVESASQLLDDEVYDRLHKILAPAEAA